MNVGTKLFIDQTVKVNEDYRKKLLKWYNATLDMVNFKNSAETISRINKWCGEITQGKINELIDAGKAGYPGILGLSLEIIEIEKASNCSA